MQNNTMPQFGVKKHDQVRQTEPVFSSGFQSQQSKSSVIAQPQNRPQPSFLTNNLNTNNFNANNKIPSSKKPSFFTSLGREQILPALVAFFGFMTLIFMVATIVLAIDSSSTVVETKADSNKTARSLSTETLMFSPGKIENINEGETYKMGQIVRTAEGQQAIAVFSDNAGAGVTLDVNWEFAAVYYGVNSSRVDQESFNISTNEVVTDLVIGRASNSQKDDVLLMILASGIVKYMPIRESLERYSFKVSGEIDGVSEAVKFYHVYETVNNELTETVMVQQADGKIIDLRSELLRIVGKDTK